MREMNFRHYLPFSGRIILIHFGKPPFRDKVSPLNPSATPEKALEKPNMGGAHMIVPKRARENKLESPRKRERAFYTETGLFGAGNC